MSDGHTDSHEIFDRFTERWPKAGDRLLAPGPDSFLAQDIAERNYRLLKGYKRAGDILVQTALTVRYDRDNLVFPALFNYRHYIELALKSIINDHGSVAGISLNTPNHRLQNLWKIYIKIAKAFNHDCSDNATIAVGNCIQELDLIDSTSTTFRYASNKANRAPPLPDDSIDLMSLHDAMNGIENFFECSALDFDHQGERWAEFQEAL